MSYESIGTRLKKAREEKKLTLEQVYAKTKVHVNILRASEEDRFREQSSVYAKGFLKIYSQFLGLDTNSIVKEFEALYMPKTPEPIVVGELSKKKFDLNWLKFNPKLIKKVLIILAVVIILLFIISLLKHRKPKKFEVPQSQPSKKQSVSTVVTKAKEEKKNKFARLTVRAKDSCWLQVKLDGKLVYQGTFKKGMADSWQANEKIELSVGNAAAVEVEINGRVLSALGRRGQAIKNILITTDGFSIDKNR